jgi:ADP-ribose pyrophosphatase YjhB (NUDIX family)
VAEHIQQELTMLLKHSVALVIRRDDQILCIRRPDDDDELPGIWGLPAGTLRESETVEDLIKRIGRDKLGIEVSPVRCLESGTQDRQTYRLEMDLWEVSAKASVDQITYPVWQWGTLETLVPGMLAGSLCCRLAVESKSRAS